MTPFDEAIRASLGALGRKSEPICGTAAAVLGFLTLAAGKHAPLFDITDDDLSQWEDGLSTILDVHESVNSGNTMNTAGRGIAGSTA